MQLQNDVMEELMHNTSEDASRISVLTDVVTSLIGIVNAYLEGSKVTLSGTVSSFAEKESAERIAWLTPGVRSVKNNIKVEEMIIV